MIDKDLLDRFEVKLVVANIGSYLDPWQPMITEIRMTDELKSELIEALELGVNCPDDDRQDVTLLLSSVRREESVVGVTGWDSVRAAIDEDGHDNAFEQHPSRVMDE